MQKRRCSGTACITNGSSACGHPAGGKKLQKTAKNYDAVIVLGCASATETVRDALGSTDCRIIKGMEATGIMNAKLKVHWPGDIYFEDCKITPGQK